MSADPEPREVAATLVKLATAAGATSAEAFVLEIRQTTLSAVGDYLRPTETRFEGVGARIVVGGRIGLAGRQGYGDLHGLVVDAMASARKVGTPDAAGFAPPLSGPLPRFADATLVEGDVERASDLVERASARLRADPEATYVKAEVRDAVRRSVIVNSLGLDVEHVSTSERLELEARLTRGTREKTAVDSWTGPGPAEASVSPEALAEGLLAQAHRAMDASPLRAPVDRVLLAPVAASQVLGIASASFSGVALGAGKTAWQGRQGAPVASQHVTLVDDPRRPGGRARIALDDEGTPTARATLVEHGILRGFVHTRASAAKAGVAPTGHASRKSVDAGLDARPIDLELSPGGLTLEEMIEGERSAILVTQPLLGSFVASRVTGDFSLVAPFAFLVRDGRVEHALPPTTVGGNAHRLLMAIDGVGNDARSFLGGTSPSLRAGGVSCAT